MGSEVAPDFISDQGICYPPAANYYGYYCTGIESPSEWDDHHDFLGFNGQDLSYSGLQAENMPYMYYTPSYGCAQSDYNPYNPFIPGAVIGVDSPFIGTQQYCTNPTYQQLVSSTPYVPVVLQSSSEIVPNGTSDPLLVSPLATVARKSDIEGAKYALSQAPASKAGTFQRVALGNYSSEASSQQFHAPAELSEGSLINMPPSKPSAWHGRIFPSNIPHATQGRTSSGSVQATDNFLHGMVPPVQNSLKVDISANNALNNFGSNVHKWTTVDNFKPRFQSNGFLDNGSRRLYMLNEQNWGHRMNKERGQWTSITVKSYTAKLTVNDSQGNIIINADQYNRDDFPVEYPDAKFFVIKSYSEDDVHKSIKYNVWSSTPNGNRRLDSAYEDAQKLSAGKPNSCPVFLFFSVNASGQFCGVAEMTGHVDFHNNMDFWQQDKWTGVFPVKWHLVKDVPNSSFRHIILENNENKPVTHSRDTQEITYIPGVNMLKIFKTSPLKGSILDDLINYEEQERVTQEEKSRLLRKTYNSLFAPAFVPANILNGSVNQPPAADGIQQDDIVSQFMKVDKKPINTEFPKNDKMPMNCTVSQPLNMDGKEPISILKKHLKADGKDGRQPNSTVNQPRKLEGKQLNVTASKLPKLNEKHLSDLAGQPLKAVEKLQNSTVGCSPKADGRQASCAVVQLLQADKKYPNDTDDQPSKGDGRQINYSVHPPKADEKRLNGSAVKPPQADGKQANSTISQPPKAAGKQFNGTVHHSRNTVGSLSKPDDLKIAGNMALTDKQVFPKFGANSQSDKKDAKPKPAVNLGGASPITKFSSLSINSKTNEADCPNAVANVVTVGSVLIKVKDLGNCPLGF